MRGPCLGAAHPTRLSSEPTGKTRAAPARAGDLLSGNSAGHRTPLGTEKEVGVDMVQASGFGFTAVRNGTPGQDEMDGGDGNDRLFGQGGNDDLDGGRGNDLLDGGEGADDLDGELGNDTLVGGAGADTLKGGAGDDALIGGTGADVFKFERGAGRDVITDFTNGEDRLEIDGFNLAAIQSIIATARQVGDGVILDLGAGTTITLQNFRLADLDLADFRNVPGAPPVTPPPPTAGRVIDGTNGADTLTGTAGNDDMDGRRGNDLLRAGAGNDSVDGGDGNDTLSGEDGQDDIDGGRGNDRLDGGAGNDVLSGGRGDDVLTGGAGADVFEFERGEGRDRITDFANGLDRIALDGFTEAQVRTILAGARQVGADVVLNLPSSSSITIADMQLSALDRTDFIL